MKKYLFLFLAFFTSNSLALSIPPTSKGVYLCSALGVSLTNSVSAEQCHIQLSSRLLDAINSSNWNWYGVAFVSVNIYSSSPLKYRQNFTYYSTPDDAAKIVNRNNYMVISSSDTDIEYSCNDPDYPDFNESTTMCDAKPFSVCPDGFFAFVDGSAAQESDCARSTPDWPEEINICLNGETSPPQWPACSEGLDDAFVHGVDADVEKAKQNADEVLQKLIALELADEQMAVEVAAINAASATAELSKNEAVIDSAKVDTLATENPTIPTLSEFASAAHQGATAAISASSTAAAIATDNDVAVLMSQQALTDARKNSDDATIAAAAAANARATLAASNSRAEANAKAAAAASASATAAAANASLTNALSAVSNSIIKSGTDLTAAVNAAAVAANAAAVSATAATHAVAAIVVAAEESASAAEAAVKAAADAAAVKAAADAAAAAAAGTGVDSATGQPCQVGTQGCVASGSGIGTDGEGTGAGDGEGDCTGEDCEPVPDSFDKPGHRTVKYSTVSDANAGFFTGISTSVLTQSFDRVTNVIQLSSGGCSGVRIDLSNTILNTVLSTDINCTIFEGYESFLSLLSLIIWSIVSFKIFASA